MLRFERHADHPVDRVWQVLTVPSELAHRFPGDVEIDLRVGGKVTFTHLGLDIDPELLPSGGIVTELDAPRLFAFGWGEGLLRFELRPAWVHARPQPQLREPGQRATIGRRMERVHRLTGGLAGRRDAHRGPLDGVPRALQRRARLGRDVHAPHDVGHLPGRPSDLVPRCSLGGTSKTVRERAEVTASAVGFYCF